MPMMLFTSNIDQCHSLPVALMRCHNLPVALIRCHYLPVALIRCRNTLRAPILIFSSLLSSFINKKLTIFSENGRTVKSENIVYYFCPSGL